ncbi:MAG: carbohydrate-binding family 9-like protein [Phycisphaerae bacterium]
MAYRTDSPIVIDGKLTEADWQNAQRFSLGRSKQDDAKEPHDIEPGWVMFAYDDEYLYLAARLTDSDVVAEGDQDQMAHWQKGDVLEWFLKPADETWYWELYATPHSLKSSYWFPGGGRLGLPSSLKYECDLSVASKIDGTLNKWQDRDNGWTTEMAIPWRDLSKHGEGVGPGSALRVLVGRYNYSRYLDGVQLTMFPQLSVTNFHTLDEYAPLHFERRH